MDESVNYHRHLMYQAVPRAQILVLAFILSLATFWVLDSADTPALAQSKSERESIDEAHYQLKLQTRAALENWNIVKKNTLTKAEKDLSEKEKVRLAPPQIIAMLNAEFLKQPDTGLFRLMTVGDTGDSLVMNTRALGPDATVVPIAGGGAYYSFTTLTHDVNELSDLHLMNLMLESGLDKKSIGILIELDSAPLASVDRGSQKVERLIAYSPPGNFSEWKREKKRLASGISRNGRFLCSKADPVLDVNFVLRTIRKDKPEVLVAFRIISKNWDRSLNILWKRI